MSILLIILWFCLLTSSVFYLVLSYVLTRDIRRLGMTSYSSFQKREMALARRRNLKFSGMLFITALFTCFVVFFIRAGLESGNFGVFLAASDIAIVLTAIMDIIENATYLYKYFPVRVTAILGKIALFSWVFALFCFFYWLPLVAVVVTLCICVTLAVFYIKFREDFNDDDNKSK